MSDDLIRRSDAIGACAYETLECYEARKAIRALPPADRPQGDVDAVTIFMREMHNLEQGYITTSEFDERIEPLRHLCYGRPQGEWIEQEDDYHHYWECSECGMGVGLDDIRNFCPYCGCRMKGADDE